MTEVIDFGAHLYPETTVPGGIRDGPLTDAIGDLEYNVSALSGQFDAAGIDRAVLSQPFFMNHEDASTTAEANDALLDVLAAEDRYYGLASIPTGAGEQRAAAEFRRCLDAGYHGGAVETIPDGGGLASPEREPVLEIADETGAPLFVHPKLEDSLGPGVFDDTHLLNAIVGREAALLESVCRVVHGGVFDRYPDLNLVYHHLGGNLGSTMGRIELQLDPGRWPGAQDDVKPFREFRATLEEHVSVDTAGFFARRLPLEAAIEELSADNVVLGTDAPYEPRTAGELAEFVDVVEGALAPAEARNVLSENALELLVNVD